MKKQRDGVYQGNRKGSPNGKMLLSEKKKLSAPIFQEILFRIPFSPTILPAIDRD